MKTRDTLSMLVFSILLLGAAGITIYSLTEVKLSSVAAAPVPGEESPSSPAPPPAMASPNTSVIPFFKILGSAIVAFAVVRFLGYSNGEVTVEIKGLKFSGTKGPATVWCLVYLVIMTSFSFV